MSVSGIEFDDGKSTDITTDATYTYIRKSLNPKATDTEQSWLCKRIVTATGVSSFANGVDNFLKPEKCMTLAATLTATYSR